ncbi:MAG: hypothetical protein KAV80_01970, partial [Methanomicrobia archaeon]|nr:hypothetical protein [Methanomicrobia archaeon]
YKDGSEIVHVLENKIEEKDVKGIIDWERRFENMQQHTGQHILSQSFVILFGKKADSTSLHISNDHNTIDIFGKYTKKDIEMVENLADDIVFQNRKIKCYFAEREEIKDKLRKIPEGIKMLRVVEIEDFDLTACGGTHLRDTGEIGLIKITDFIKKGEFTRLEFVCGLKALKDYRNRNYDYKKAVNLLNSQNISEEIEKLQNERRDLIKKIRYLEKSVFDYEVSEMIKSSEKIGKYKLIMKIYEDRDIESLIKEFDQENITVFLADKKNARVMGFSKIKEINIGKIMRDVGKFIDGGGGGNEDLGKAGGKNLQGIEEAFMFIKEEIKKIKN